MKERFPFFNRNITHFPIKSILRGNISGLKINHPHFLIYNQNITRCNGFGHKIKKISTFGEENDVEYYYIKHYAYKSTEEFIDKLKRGDVLWGNKNKRIILNKIKAYFRNNIITIEKINYIEQKIGFNLNYFRKILKKN